MALRKCSWCERKFTKPEHLMRHERSHTRERPYVCKVCNKTFSRSDVLYRHTKVHSRKGHNPQNSSASQEGLSFQDPIIFTPPAIIPQSESANTQLVHTETVSLVSPHLEDSLSDPALLQNEPAASLPGELLGVILPADNLDGDVDVVQNDLPLGDATLSIPTSLSSSTPKHSRIHGDGNSTSLGTGPSIATCNLSDDALTLDLLNVDGWNFDLAQTSWPFQNSFHAFPTSPVSYQIASERPEPLSTPLSCKETHYSPSESTSSATSQIPLDRFSQVERCWQSCSLLATRLTPNLWEDIILCKTGNIYCGFDHISSSPSAGRQRRSQWEFHEESLGQIQAELDAVTQPAPWRSRQVESFLVSTTTSPFESSNQHIENLSGISWPPPEVFGLALEMYFCHFHPELPLIHVPTFSTQQAYSPLLLVICLIGFHLLGTAGARQFVAQIFPITMKLISQELSEAARGSQHRKQQLSIFATSLLFLHLAFLSGDRTKIGQSEVLYLNLLTITQIRGLFSVNEEPSLETLEKDIPDLDLRWKAWARIECVKHLIIRLVEIDSWFAADLSINPTVRPDTVKVVPPSETKLFNAPTSSQWSRLFHTTSITSKAITTASMPSSSTKLDASSLYTSLILIHLSIYEVHYRLITLNETICHSSKCGNPRSQAELQPWRMYDDDPRGRKLVRQITGPITLYLTPVESNNLNVQILWHSLCIILGANLNVFELAAGRAGPESAQRALEDIAAWSKTAAARRSCLHAAYIFKLLVHRRVSDIVSINSVQALFYSALVLGLFILTVGENQQDHNATPIELYSDIDWSCVGSAGFDDKVNAADGLNSDISPVSNFIFHGGSITMAGNLMDGGYEQARRFLLHCAELMHGIGRGKFRTFSQILHIMSDDLSEIQTDDGFVN